MNFKLYLSIFLFLFSCSSPKEKDEEHYTIIQKKLKVIDSLNFGYFQNISNFYSVNLIKKIDDSLYTLVTSNLDSIILLNPFKKPSYGVSKIIPIDKYKIIDYYFNNDSTLFFTGERNNKTYLIKKTISKNNNTEVCLISDSVHLNYNPFIGANMYIYKNNLVFDAIRPNFNGIENSFEFSLFNVKTKKPIHSHSKKNISEELHPLFDFPGWLVKGDTIVVYYGYKNDVTIYNAMDLKQISTARVKSNFSPIFFSCLYKDEIISFQTIENFIIEKPYYAKLIWHEDLKKFIRIYKKEQKLKDKNGLLNLRYNGPWSLIVADENLKTEFEINIPKNTYLFYSYIITKNGIGFQRINSDKDNLIFDIIKI